MKFDIVVCKSSNGVIGDSITNSIPWKIKKDIRFFRKITTENNDNNNQNAIIMGYKTWKSLPVKKLPNRINCVISSTYTKITIEEGIVFGPSFDFIKKYLSCLENVNKVFLIGGGKIFQENINHKDLDLVYVTNIKKKMEGDIFFPKLLNNFQLIKGVKDKENEYNLEFLVYKHHPNNYVHPEYQYLNFIEKIMDDGFVGPDRTGIGTKSIFGTQFKWDMSVNFPLLTTKKMYFKGIVEELLWFLRGETDNKILQDKKIHIWDGNSSRDFLDKQGLTHLKEGDIGKSYGFQFRHFGGEYIDCETDYSGKGYDQFQNVLDLIKNKPESRRIIISLWNPCDLDKTALPPCLFFYQFKVQDDTLHTHILNRSNDMALGHPWNIGTGALMTYLICHLTGLKPGILTHSISDAHIYLNHLEPLKEQLDRKPFSFPILNIKDMGQKDISDYKYSDFELIGYNSYPSIKMDMAI